LIRRRRSPYIQPVRCNWSFTSSIGDGSTCECAIRRGSGGCWGKAVPPTFVELVAPIAGLSECTKYGEERMLVVELHFFGGLSVGETFLEEYRNPLYRRCCIPSQYLGNLR
jgi:hypothetical protein